MTCVAMCIRFPGPNPDGIAAVRRSVSQASGTDTLDVWMLDVESIRKLKSYDTCACRHMHAVDPRANSLPSFEVLSYDASNASTTGTAFQSRTLWLTACSASLRHAVTPCRSQCIVADVGRAMASQIRGIFLVWICGFTCSSCSSSH